MALVPGWMGARLPQWITGALVLERLLGIQGLGSDWSTRVTLRDRPGMGVWIAVLALLWWSSRVPRRSSP